MRPSGNANSHEIQIYKFMRSVIYFIKKTLNFFRIKERERWKAARDKERDKEVEKKAAEFQRYQKNRY
jgi:hypothetical protein